MTTYAYLDYHVIKQYILKKIIVKRGVRDVTFRT